MQFNRCYYFNMNALDYANADAFCKSNSASLMMLRNLEELYFMATFCPSGEECSFYVSSNYIPNISTL